MWGNRPLFYRGVGKQKEPQPIVDKVDALGYNKDRKGAVAVCGQPLGLTKIFGSMLTVRVPAERSTRFWGKRNRNQKDYDHA